MNGPSNFGIRWELTPQEIEVSSPVPIGCFLRATYLGVGWSKILDHKLLFSTSLWKVTISVLKKTIIIKKTHSYEKSSCYSNPTSEKRSKSCAASGEISRHSHGIDACGTLSWMPAIKTSVTWSMWHFGPRWCTEAVNHSCRSAWMVAIARQQLLIKGIVAVNNWSHKWQNAIPWRVMRKWCAWSAK